MPYGMIPSASAIASTSNKPPLSGGSLVSCLDNERTADREMMEREEYIESYPRGNYKGNYVLP
jgi:hypothetical protein